MAEEFYQRARQLCDQALDHPEAERMSFLQAACTGDPTLLRAVEQLLRSRNSPASFLDTAPTTGEEHIGRFLIRGELGRGAMGVVYDAIDPLIGRSVAVKVIHLGASTDPQQADFLRDRLFREARSAGQLFHPGIVVILDVGQQGDTAFIAMERVDGKSLLQTLAAGPPVETARALEILRQTAAALDYAHGRGIVHRDIKPANIMLQDGGMVKIADFGIAKVISGQQATVTGIVMGTPSYMSPEQIESQPVDGRSDQFSLTVVAFELLTGARPFQSDSLATLTYMIVHGNRPSARAVNPRLPESVDEVLGVGFSRNPAARYQTCSQFVATLTAAIDSTPLQNLEKTSVSQPSVSRPVVSQPVMQPAHGSRLVLYVLAFAAALVLAGASWFMFSKQPGQARAGPDVPPVIPPPAIAAAPVITPAPVKATPAPPIKAPVPKKEAPVATIQLFEAEPSSIEPGASTKLRWNVTHAKEIQLDHGIGPVAASGTMDVSPLASTTYEMTATGASKEVRSTVSVEVKPAAGARPRVLYEQALKMRSAGLGPAYLAVLQKAAAAGSPRAMVDLGELYRDGDGVTKDENEAAHWFRRAADTGNAVGMVFLGVMYQNGAGVEKDDSEAVKWFQKAADRGNSAGIYHLAIKYERGEGVARNVEKAVELYQKAADMGNVEAGRRLRLLNRRK
jgi:serine/threonine protein kinase